MTFDQLLSDNACPSGNGDERVIVCQTDYRSAVAVALLQSRDFEKASYLAGGLLVTRRPEALQFSLVAIISDGGRMFWADFFSEARLFDVLKPV